MKTLAVLYRRVSTDQQDNSLDVQETLNDEYARRMNLPTLAAFEDADVSGSVPFLQRDGGRALMHRLQLGDITDLITAKQDRLGRDTMDTITTIRAIWALGLVPHFTCEGGALPRTPQNELLFEIKASVAQYERNLIVERTQAVMRHKFNQGELCGNVPYGFDCVYTFTDGYTQTSAEALSPPALFHIARTHGEVKGKQMQPNSAEQTIIRTMHTLRQITTTVPGNITPIPMSYTAIAQYLNNEGWRTKQGKAWGCGNVRSVLLSRHTARLLAAVGQDSVEP